MEVPARAPRASQVRARTCMLETGICLQRGAGPKAQLQPPETQLTTGGPTLLPSSPWPWVMEQDRDMKKLRKKTVKMKCFKSNCRPWRKPERELDPHA